MDIKELQDMWDVDCILDNDKLGEQSIATSQLHAKYLRHLVDVKQKLIKIKYDQNILRKNKFRYYRGELSRAELTELNWDQWQGTKPLKNEMDEFLSGDSDLNTLKCRIEYFEIMKSLLDEILDRIKSRNWDLKNAIAWKQFLAGG